MQLGHHVIGVIMTDKHLIPYAYYPFSSKSYSFWNWGVSKNIRVLSPLNTLRAVHLCKVYSFSFNRDSGSSLMVEKRAGREKKSTFSKVHMLIMILSLIYCESLKQL